MSEFPISYLHYIWDQKHLTLRDRQIFPFMKCGCRYYSYGIDFRNNIDGYCFLLCEECSNDDYTKTRIHIRENYNDQYD